MNPLTSTPIPITMPSSQVCRRSRYQCRALRTIATPTRPPSQPVAETPCAGDASIDDSTSTCVPEPAEIDAAMPQIGTADGRQHGVVITESDADSRRTMIP